ncbi:ArsR family transcriptional regulator [Acinetobacter sp. NIPH 1958]|uniref:VpaChn25_0724 family phage protein n=1 Tax=Acinetobacter sp. NIPH 1958 TaxID=2923430 RepID=UPI001F4BADD3|nr:ArsR family transcriptional regulator [Acinetobacter sp. NIPH 1958]MCH7357436.1 ArsR family transcriptional regulator [Acinetobacter sp. NIPH 1958]
MTKKYLDKLIEEARLVILRCLVELPSYRANSSTLTSLLDTYAISMTRDSIKTQLNWLAEQGLIEIEDDLGSVLVVKLTERGQDIANGRSTTHGVKRPSA